MRILVVRIGRAGDMVMTTPAIQAILQCFPDATITLLTSPDGKRILKNFDPRITTTWVWQRSSITSSLEKRRVFEKIRHTAFGIIFCFETNPSVQALFEHHPADFYSHSSHSPPAHCAQIYLNIVARACSENHTPIWANLPVNKTAIDEFDRELLNYGITMNDTVVALHPTYSGYSRFNLRKRGARKHKLWPTNNYAALAQRLAKHQLADGSKPRVIIDLLDNEMILGRRILQAAGDNIQLINKKPNFERYKALLKRADLLVAPDTGPMHIAAAVNTRLVALFSGKSPDDCGPYMPPNRFSALRAENMPDAQSGISAISVDTVYHACVQQLNEINNDKAMSA